MHQFLNNIFNIQTALAQPFVQSGTSSTGSAASESTNQFQNMATTVIQTIPYWVTGFIVIILSVILSRIVKSTVENRMADAGMEEEHKEIQLVAGRAASAAVLMLGITAGLKIAGLDLTSVIAAAAFGVGFAMQDLIMNFVSGIFILLQKQFTIGDWVKVNGTEGIIKNIQARYTIIKKFDGTNVVVPNSDLFKNQVNSLTSNPERRFQIDLAVDLYLDLKEVIDLLYRSIDKCDKILKYPKPSIIVQAPGSYYNSIRIRAWVVSKKGILRPISSLVRQIHKDFYRKGWSWPYPTDKLVFDKDVPPDVNIRAKNYIEKHKKALKKQTIIIQQQQQNLQKQEQQPVPNAMPQAQQIGVGGAQMETPVWLQQAAPQATPQPAQQNAQPENQPPVQYPSAQAPVVIQKIEIGPEVKTVQGQQQPVMQYQPQTQFQNQPQNLQEPTPTITMPIVMAPPVESAQQPVSGVAMPLPDVQMPVGASLVDPSQQNPLQ